MNRCHKGTKVRVLNAWPKLQQAVFVAMELPHQFVDPCVPTGERDRRDASSKQPGSKYDATAANPA